MRFRGNDEDEVTKQDGRKCDPIGVRASYCFAGSLEGGARRRTGSRSQKCYRRGAISVPGREKFCGAEGTEWRVSGEASERCSCCSESLSVRGEGSGSKFPARDDFRPSNRDQIECSNRFPRRNTSRSVTLHRSPASRRPFSNTHRVVRASRRSEAHVRV